MNPEFYEEPGITILVIFGAPVFVLKNLNPKPYTRNLHAERTSMDLGFLMLVYPLSESRGRKILIWRPLLEP